jgi:hypothetical protein
MTSIATPTDKPVAPLADRLAPSIPAVFFVCLTLFATLISQGSLLNGDGDLARHLRHGLYMFQHRSLIWHDPFSYTRAGQPFVPFEYGSQLLYASVYKVAGLAGVTVFAALLIGATYALLARLLLRRKVDPMLVMVTVIAAAVLGCQHWLARPHLISWLLIVVCFGLIEFERRPPLWSYPALFALWANLHGGWLYGIALLGIYLTGSAVQFYLDGRKSEDRERLRHYAAALGLAVPATLVTPMGFELWAHLFRHLGDTYVIDHTMEFQSPNFHPFAAKILLAILVAAILALIASRRRIRIARLLLFLAGIWWALTAARNISLFGLTGLTVLALHIDPEWRNLPSEWFARRRAAFAAGALRASTITWVLPCSVFLALVAFGHGSILGHEIVVDEFSPKVFPVAAVKKAQEAQLGGPLLADFAWGGYVLFAWPGQRVFIDGGTDFYGAKVMREFVQVATLQPGWRAVLDRYRVQEVLTNSHSGLAHELVRTPGWSLWYCDSLAIVARRVPSSSGAPDADEAKLESCAGPAPSTSH